MGKRRKIMGLSRSKHLKFMIYIKEISRKILGLARSKDLTNKKKEKEKKKISPPLVNRLRDSQSWVWHEVQFWICFDLYRIKKKIMGLARSTDLNLLWMRKKNHGWREVQIWICIDLYRMRKKNHGLGGKVQIWKKNHI